MKKKVLLATGVLSWHKRERVSDRYGTVTVFDEDSDNKKIYDGSKIYLESLKKHIGQKGKLVCEVLEIRESTHIGDFYRCFFPKTPKIGEKIILGEGELFSEHPFNKDTIGLRPNDDRKFDWLDPKKLYKAHEQTVNLYFIPFI